MPTPANRSPSSRASVERPAPASAVPDRPSRAVASEAGQVATGQAAAGNSTAERAIDILLLFDEVRPGWSAAEIAARLGMPKTTVYRYLNSLKSCALIAEDGQGGFRLGPRVFPLARTAKASLPVVRIVQPHLQALARRFDELVLLQQRVGSEILTLDRIEPAQRVTLASTRSHLLPWPATSSAKLLLALAPADERAQLLRMLKPTRYTANTLPTRAALRDALDRVVEDGYAVTDQERDDGVWGAAAPVVERGTVHHAIAMAAPRFRMSPAKIAEAIRALREAAAAASADVAATEF